MANRQSFLRAHALVALMLLLCLHPAALAGAGAKKKAPAKKSLAERINAIVSQPELTRAHWGVEITDADSGKPVFSLNQNQLFIPASNVKLFTTAALLATAGPEYRFRTTVETAGKIDGSGRLQGDMVIVGRGDPNLSGRVMPYQVKTERVAPHTQVLEELADQVARSGVKVVEGDVIGDDTFFAPERYGPGWAQDDLTWLDGAPVTALAFNDNVVFVNVRPGAQAGDKAVVSWEPELNYYESDNRVVTTATGSKSRVGIDREPGSKKVTLWGSVATGGPGVTEALAIEDPAEYTALIFRALLEQRRITVRGKVRTRHGDAAQFYDVAAPAGDKGNTERQSDGASNAAGGATPLVLAEHISLPLKEDVRVTNKTSQNLHAEMALRLVGKLSGQTATFEGGSAAVKQFLLKAGLKEDEFVLVDGSGLSRLDLATPAAVVRLLTYERRQPWGAIYEDSLPLSGVDGSLTDRFANSPASGLVHGKTGSLSHVNALSGYAETPLGRHFVFSIFCNNHDSPGSKVLAAIDSIVQLLVTEGDGGR